MEKLKYGLIWYPVALLWQLLVAIIRCALLPLPKLLKGDWIAAIVTMLEKAPIQLVIFIATNIFIGLIGVWAQVATAIYTPTTDFSTELLKTLRTGGLYTFAIPFLVSTSFFVLVEYIENNNQGYRDEKGEAFLYSIMLVIALSVMAGMLAQHQLTTPAVNEINWNFTDFLQIFLTILSVVHGVYLYSLSKVDGYKDRFEELRRQQRDQTAEAVKEAKTDNTSDIKV